MRDHPAEHQRQKLQHFPRDERQTDGTEPQGRQTGRPVRRQTHHHAQRSQTAPVVQLQDTTEDRGLRQGRTKVPEACHDPQAASPLLQLD